MKIIPAMDLKSGEVVRLYQGCFESKEVMSKTPMAVMTSFVDAGVRHIHLVDLDGAIGSREVNREILCALCALGTGVDIQIGGGFKTLEAVEEALSWGVSKVIIGSMVVTDWPLFASIVKRYPHKVAVALDVSEGYLKTRGWLDQSKLLAVDVAKRCEALGVERLIVTDVARDGTLAGPNIGLCCEVAEVFSGEVIVSGGIASLKDLEAVKAAGLGGVVIGKALYDGRFTLEQALEMEAAYGI